MIEPTVGRVVLYTNIGAHPEQQKHPALIAHVWSDTCVNLTVFDGNGVNYSRTSVPLIQDDAPRSPDGGYCEWMEYQKGQAAKTEELEKGFAASMEELIKQLDAKVEGLKEQLDAQRPGEQNDNPIL